MKYDQIRRKTRPVHVGRVPVGGDAPISVQSMTNTDTHDFAATLAQVRALEAARCDVDIEHVEQVAGGAAFLVAVRVFDVETQERRLRFGDGAYGLDWVYLAA